MMSRSISRRAFLQRGALAASAVSVAPWTRAAAAEPRRAAQRVVVVGAGLAGLAAATALTAQGHDVTVCEAQMRAGGRVATLRAPFADGLYAEAGAMFFADVHDLTMHYARTLGLPLVPIIARELAAFYYIRGQKITLTAEAITRWPVELTDSERRLGIFGMTARYIAPPARVVRQAIDQGWSPGSPLPSAISAYDGMTFAEFLRKRGASPGAIALLRLGYLDQWGDGIDTVSALSMLRDSALLSDARNWYSIKGGVDQLPRGMAAALGGRVHYGACVTRVVQDAAKVRVWTDRSGRSEVLVADRVVFAIPFSVLRGLAIAPPLSEGKRTAVAELSHTSIARVYLQFRTKSWGGSSPLAWGGTDLPIMSVREPTYNQDGARGILEAVMAGPNARRIAAMPEDERIAFVLAEMERVFPETSGQFERGTSKCWDLDPWARGDYAWFKPGEMGTLAPHLSPAEGRIHFAGDQTSDRPGWMQGALASGHRAAQEIDASV